MAMAQIAKTLLFNFIVDEVCYPPYQCFRRDGPFEDKILPLPENPTFINTKFFYFFAENEVPIEIDIHGELPEFRKRVPTVIIIHGFLEDQGAFWIHDMTNSILQTSEANVTVVDWKIAARFPYNQAISNMRIVAAQATRLLERLYHEVELLPFNTHLIGFSLGAHLAGLVGQNMNKRQMTIGRISGLDPAGPYFEDGDTRLRLDPSDAQFVDVIHSDSKLMMFGGLGYSEPLGHVDFYPNNGYNQPGCTSLGKNFKSKHRIIRGLSCSHYRAVEYFAESITDRNKFLSYLCDSANNFRDGKCHLRSCHRGRCNNMGYHARKIPGKYYLNTNTKAPYAARHFLIKLTTGRENFADSLAKLTFRLYGDDVKSNNITTRSRYLQSGSAKIFLVHTSEHMQPLKEIKISHKALLWSDSWLLNKIVIISLDTRQRYIGCVNRWLSGSGVWVRLRGPTRERNRCRQRRSSSKPRYFFWWW